MAASGTALAEPSQPPNIVGVRVGLADRYKAGLWTQVEVVLQGGSRALSGEVSLVVPDGDGVPSRVSTAADQPCQLLPGRETKVRLLCRFGRVQGTLRVEFRVDGNMVAQRTFETAASPDAEHFLPALEFQGLVVMVGDAPSGLEEAFKLGGVEAEYRPVAARLSEVEQLPTHWCGYEGVDAVVLSTSRPAIYGKLAAHGDQVQALDEWVQMGGRLVVCLGAQAEKVLAADGPLRRFVPGRLAKMASLNRTGALESYCGSRMGVPQAGNVPTMLRVPRLADVQGTIEAREADVPLVIRTPRGFGQIICLAADLDQPPLDKWPDRPLLVAKLLDRSTGHGEESEEGAAMMHLGFGDLSGQLRSALDSFTGVRLAPFWLVAGLIAGYLLLIGPGDYFFLRKLVGRMAWTWLTFPLLVVLVCAGSYALAHRLKGDQLKLSQVDLVDVDAAAGRLRGAAWLNLFSPQMESFNLSVEPRLLDGSPARDARRWTTWLGLPGGALGGMNPHAGGLAQWTEPYSFSTNLDTMLDVPIQVWSTKSLTARWTAPTKIFPRAELSDQNQLLTGTVTNTLGFPLEQCILAYGSSVYDLGTIAPGESVQLGPMAKRSELKTLLTGRKLVSAERETGEKYHQEATPYDVSSTDIPYILRTMMFYEAAGGRSYTGLGNGYQDFVDLSALLKADRAILMTQEPNRQQDKWHGASLLRDGRPLGGRQNKHVTLYRFVFPVTEGKEWLGFAGQSLVFGTRLLVPPPLPLTMIKTQDLTKIYGNLYAINNLSLDLAEGDLFGYIGPNGSGKTTTMRILATLLQPTWGEASVCGYSIYTHPKEIRRLIGYMPDFFGVYDDMKVIEYLEFFAAAYRIKGPARRKVCNEMLELVDLGYKRDAFVTSLSRGMTQRLGLARVLLARSQGAVVGRAGQRPGPPGADRDSRSVEAAGQDGENDHGLQPHSARVGRHLQQGGHHRARRAVGQRQRGRRDEAGPPANAFERRGGGRSRAGRPPVGAEQPGGKRSGPRRPPSPYAGRKRERLQRPADIADRRGLQVDAISGGGDQPGNGVHGADEGDHGVGETGLGIRD